MNTYSLKAHIEQYTNENPNHVYTMICECNACADKKWVKVLTASIPSVATNLRYDDMITVEQFNNLVHRVVQKLG